MSDVKKLLEKRKEIKKKKPNFLAQDAHKVKRVGKGWKRPRGSDSKMRLSMKGYRKSVSPGYGSPSDVRGMHKSGLYVIIVNSVMDLNNVDKEKYGIVVASTVGMKKKLAILEKAKELGVKVLNIDHEKYSSKANLEMSERKKKRAEKEKKKTEKKAKKEEKKKDKLAEKVMDEEEKAKQDKKEKDKILTTKDA